MNTDFLADQGGKRPSPREIQGPENGRGIVKSNGPRGAAAESTAVHDARTAVRIIDCDVHPIVKDGIESLYPYMPEGWRRRFRNVNAGIGNQQSTTRYLHPHGGGLRRDAAPPGGLAGEDPQFVRADLLDKYGIDRALLISIEAGNSALGAADGSDAAVIVAAFNDFFLDQWVDERLRYALCVSPHDPLKAAGEIRRIGANDAVAAVYLPLLDIRMGNQHYHPIYEAAADLSLPIVIHPAAAESIYVGAATFACGMPERYVERYVNFPQIGEASVASLIFSGVFSRYPNLKVICVEFGFSWAVPLRMDKAWQEVRSEVPWVKHPPSEYVHKHLGFTTQPVDEPNDVRDLEQMVERYLADVLLFSTDYPHWDNDLPDRVLLTLTQEMRGRIFRDNAATRLRL